MTPSTVKMSGCFYFTRDVLIQRVSNAIEKIENQKIAAEERPARGLNAPPYHWFEYKGYRCCSIMCLALKSKWCGFVFIPKGRELKWPDNARTRPFRVGVDFSFPFNDGVIVGFHTMHLQDDVSLQGVQFEKTSDYVADQLKDYIDVCVGELRNVSAVIRSHRTQIQTVPAKRKKGEGKTKNVKKRPRCCK